MSIVSSTLVLCAVLGTPVQDGPVSLGRVFVKNQKLAYEVRSSLKAEVTQRGVETSIPEEHELNYDFTTQVEDLKSDGIAVIHYLRPVMHEVTGETFTSGPEDHVEKVDYNVRLTVSPINEILEQKDLAPPKPTKKPGADSDGGDGGSGDTPLNRIAPTAGKLQGGIGQFVSELIRLSLFAGSLDSALDFAPKTPFNDVKIGDTWKKTVGYQPQKLQGKGDKQAIQRLDYTYTYKGIVDSNGKKVYRVEGVLDLNTDLAAFFNQMLEMKAAETHLKKIPLTMHAVIEFDLDMKSRMTLLAEAKTNASFAVFLTDYDDAVESLATKGHTTMKLAGERIVVPTKKG